MKQRLLELWATTQEKAYDNKETLIRVGGIVAGAVIGFTVATIIANAQEDILLEEILMSTEVAPEVNAE